MTHKHGGDIYNYQDIKDFSANINFLGMPRTVRTAAIRAVDESIHYPDPECRSLRAALVQREKSFCSDILPEHIICGNGAAELIFALAGAWQPERALIVSPSFYEYEQALYVSGCEITRFMLDPEEHFCLGDSFVSAAASFAANEAFADDTRIKEGSYCETFSKGFSANRRSMIILGNPNNPTGALIERKILEKLICLCEKYHILLVLDESFLDFLDTDDQKRTHSGAVKILGNPNLFVIRSFTKIYALPGIRFGYGLSSDRDLLERMRMLIQPWNVSLIAQKAAEAAASEYEFVRNSAKMISLNRDHLIRALRDCGLTVFPSAANFLLVRGPKNLKETCLENGILIRDCSNFPGLEPTGDGQGFFRVCVRSWEENDELVGIIRECMNSR
ncbi:MAG: aminotransferase class I/II-fold pyridoxal phosphate-dependent enzyme [Clostridiales bacterium]|nr:aminotransferase class I/II-fold pyridoxal phosphate-dependent enzyme [Clostridiales bacterium]